MSISEGEEEYNIKLGNKIFPLDKETLTASGRKGKFSLPPTGPASAIPISIKRKGEDGDGDPYKFNPYHEILNQYDEAERSSVPEYTGDFKYDEEIPYEKQGGSRHWAYTYKDTPNGILISELDSFMKDLGYEKTGYRALAGGSKKKKKSRKRNKTKRKKTKKRNKTRKRKKTSRLKGGKRLTKKKKIVLKR